MIRVHLIRHCYPSLSTISDMGIKCWTCFWVILGAHGATTYTPLNQWGLGFVAKPQAQRESVFPEQSPCPRSAAWILKNEQLRVRWVYSLSWPAASMYLNCVWFGWRATAASSTAGARSEHLNPIVKKQSNNKAFLWQRLADAAMFMICLLPPLISTLLPPMDDKKKIPILISSDRAWPRLPWEGCMVVEVYWGHRDSWPRGKMTQARLGQNTGHTAAGCYMEHSSLVKKNPKHAQRLQHTALQALVRGPQGVITTSVIQHWSISSDQFTGFQIHTFSVPLRPSWGMKGSSGYQLASFISGTFKMILNGSNSQEASCLKLLSAPYGRQAAVFPPAPLCSVNIKLCDFIYKSSNSRGCC